MRQSYHLLKSDGEEQVRPSWMPWSHHCLAEVAISLHFIPEPACPLKRYGPWPHKSLPVIKATSYACCHVPSSGHRMLDVGDAYACSTCESIRHRQCGNRYIEYLPHLQHYAEAHRKRNICEEKCIEGCRRKWGLKEMWDHEMLF